MSIRNETTWKTIIKTVIMQIGMESFLTLVIQVVEENMDVIAYNEIQKLKDLINAEN